MGDIKVDWTVVDNDKLINLVEREQKLKKPMWNGVNLRADQRESSRPYPQRVPVAGSSSSSSCQIKHDTRLQASRVENKLGLIDVHFRELCHESIPPAKSRKASYSKVGNFRVFRCSDLELLPARSLSHLNYDGIVYRYARIVDRPDRIHVVRLYRGRKVNNQLERNLHYYAKVWHPNLAQVFGVVVSERSILLTGSENVLRLQLILLGLPEGNPFYLPSEEHGHYYNHWHYIFRILDSRQRWDEEELERYLNFYGEGGEFLWVKS
ncbi:hypothetical protein K435DRAFT_920194 [Dendrothele bispora CBS 962.96]|uniref:Uncharacterized protein n=1 Tax=Dendrothele bispora (strain CBS 962.96) TaxID=1314807 RepID=A0A4S8LEH7_DENBC|nr:hypothetical protein K435DRAFT_920194 [Dendrothele bispora CBS 962.96]